MLKRAVSLERGAGNEGNRSVAVRPRLLVGLEVSETNTHRYDLVVIGGGTAGLTAAVFAARLGAKVAVIEQDRVGGGCTWTACVPTKTMVKTAKVAFQANHADRYGLPRADLDAEWSSIMAHVHSVVEQIHRGESPEILRSEGIDLFTGEARFIDSRTVAAGDDRFSSPRILIATGSRPKTLPSPDNADRLPNVVTYRTLWSLESLPTRLVVVGGGPQGCEMAQAFARLGSQVTLISGSDRLLPRDEPEVSALLTDILKEEGVVVELGAEATEVVRDDDGTNVVTAEGRYPADVILAATGRSPEVEGLQLDKANVRVGPAGIQVNDHLLTSQAGIFAAGDCIGGYQFTHLAAWHGFVATRNALLPGNMRVNKISVPWVTFTDPEIAHVGMTEEEARARYGRQVKTALKPMAEVDRARTEVATDGFIKLVYSTGGRLRGVTVASAQGGESIQGWGLALDHGLKLGDVARTLNAYPTYSLANMELAADLEMERLLSGASGKVVKWVSAALLRFRTGGR